MTLDEERAHAAGLPTQWRAHGPLARLAFFVLTCIAAMAFYGFWYALRLVPEIATCVACIGAAETLIRRYRFWLTGVESALWISGLCAVIPLLPGHSRYGWVLAIAIACAIAAIRLRQPYFGAASVLLCVAWLGLRGAGELVLIASVVVMLHALVSLGREQERPSAERLYEILLIAAPILPALWRGAVGPRIFITINLAWAFALIAAALVLKHHAPAIAGAVCLVIAFIGWQDLVAILIEWQLIVAGALLLAASALVSRRLRENTRGLVMTPSSVTPFDDELQIAATSALTPRVEPAQEPSRGEGGGEFGGAGATGKF